MKKHGHYCKICGEYKSNEKFSGKGHAAHICKACYALFRLLLLSLQIFLNFLLTFYLQTQKAKRPAEADRFALFYFFCVIKLITSVRVSKTHFILLLGKCFDFGAAIMRPAL